MAARKPPMIDPTMMTLTEAAKKLRVKYLAAYNLMLDGTLDGRQIDGHWRVTRASVRREFDRARRRGAVR